jgi:uncharacterized protein
MVRLAQDTFGAPGDVNWTAQATIRPVTGGAPELWLQLSCRAAAELTCQRCLQPVKLDLQAERAIRFVSDEAEAERLDELSDDDVLAQPGGGLDLRQLVEDELILALPLVPRHDTCPQPLPMASSAAADEVERPNPFQALAALKRRSPDDA